MCVFIRGFVISKMASLMGLTLVLLLCSCHGERARISRSPVHAPKLITVQNEENASASYVVNKVHTISRAALSPSSRLMRKVRDTVNSRPADSGKVVSTPETDIGPSVPEEHTTTRPIAASSAGTQNSKHVESTAGRTNSVTLTTATTSEAVSTSSPGLTNGFSGPSHHTGYTTSTPPRTAGSESTASSTNAQQNLTAQTSIPSTLTSEAPTHSFSTAVIPSMSGGASQSTRGVTATRVDGISETPPTRSAASTSSHRTTNTPASTEASSLAARTSQGVSTHAAGTLSTQRETFASTNRPDSRETPSTSLLSSSTMTPLTSSTISLALTSGMTGVPVPSPSMTGSPRPLISSTSSVGTTSSQQPARQTSASGMSGTTASSQPGAASGGPSVPSTSAGTTRTTFPKTHTHTATATAQPGLASENPSTVRNGMSSVSAPAQTNSAMTSHRNTFLPASHFQTMKPPERTHTKHNGIFMTTTASVGHKINYENLSNQEKYIIVGSMVGAVLVIVVIVFFVILRGGGGRKGRRGSVYLNDAINLESAPDRARPDLEALEKEAERKQKESLAGKLVIDG